ncbi:HNH endonuclease, partial [Rhodococcus koreensis]
AKESDGWTARPVHRPDRTHLIELGTPTGHHYHSAAPPLPTPAHLRAS